MKHSYLNYMYNENFIVLFSYNIYFLLEGIMRPKTNTQTRKAKQAYPDETSATRMTNVDVILDQNQR